MAQPKQMSLPGLVLLLVVVAVLYYFELLPSGEQARDATSAQKQTTQRDTADRRTGRERSSSDGAIASGAFAYYTLALSWSPTHCESADGARDAQQCAPRHGRAYGFILHGLWPQYEDGFPESCETRERPFVPDRVISEMADIMPSRGLVIHQYRKHGTCSGLGPEAYFDKSRALFRSITVPDKFRSPQETQFLSPDDVIDAFAGVNPKLDRNMMAVVCAGPGNRFRELRVCFSKAGEPVRCGRNEAQQRLCRTQRMHVPPLRAAARN